MILYSINHVGNITYHIQVYNLYQFHGYPCTLRKIYIIEKSPEAVCEPPLRSDLIFLTIYCANCYKKGKILRFKCNQLDILAYKQLFTRYNCYKNSNLLFLLDSFTYTGPRSPWTWDLRVVGSISMPWFIYSQNFWYEWKYNFYVDKIWMLDRPSINYWALNSVCCHQNFIPIDSEYQFANCIALTVLIKMSNLSMW